MSKVTLYFCHYCCDYFTNNKTDLKRHFERQNKCICTNVINTYQDASILSLNKKYVFDNDFNTKSLSKNDILFIVTNYTDNINYIPKNYKKKKKEGILNHVLEKTSEENKEIIKSVNDLFDPETNKYVCVLCKSSYTYKQGIERHLLEKNRCTKLQKIQSVLQETSDTIQKIKEKEKEKEEKISQMVIQDNRVQNIQNNNNLQANNYHFKMRDFIHEKYDLSHIKDEFYLQKDFFLYHNFLRAIMENEKNQNIFFSDKEAIIYSDNELNKMSSDKAGYLILDKLSQSFTQIYNKQDANTQEFYEFIHKYYYVIKGHYKHDTIFKDYDVDKKQFVYTANSSMFRSRDKYLTKMDSTLSKYKDNTRKNMSIQLSEINDIPTMNPNIEDFASIKMRYRDLKDKD